MQSHQHQFGFFSNNAWITWIYAIGIPGLIAITITVLLNLSYPDPQKHFILLAQSFLEGKAFYGIDPTAIWYDISPYLGNLYLPMGPFPAILLLPFARWTTHLSTPSTQSIINVAITIFIATYCFKLCRLLWYTQRSSLILTTAFLFSSPLFGTITTPKTWYVAHNIVVALLLFALHEHLTKKRLWLIGLVFCAILGTRTLAALGIVFFIIDIVRHNPRILFFCSRVTTFFTKTKGFENPPHPAPTVSPLSTPETDSKQTMKLLAQLLCPFIFGVGMMAVYNLARFDSPIEQGYTYQNVAHYGTENRDAGLFSIRHVPANLYYLFLAPPAPIFASPTSHVLVFPFIDVDPWGMSIFITSPYLLFLFFSRNKIRETTLLLFTCAVVLIPILCYYGIGFSQIGYRYALDFFPLLFLAFAYEYRQQTTRTQSNEHEVLPRFRALISGSILLNIFFVILFQT